MQKEAFLATSGVFIIIFSKCSSCVIDFHAAKLRSSSVTLALESSDSYEFLYHARFYTGFGLTASDMRAKVDKALRERC